jgi:ferredoxin-NADP reductase
MTTGMLALIIIAAILSQVVGVALVGLYRRRHQLRALELPRGRPPARMDVTPAESVIPSTPPTAKAAWDGFREFVVQRRVIEDAAGSVCSFYLVPADGGSLPAFRPGQYLTFSLPIRNPATPQARTVVRCYSLSDRPRPDYYRVTIKRVPSPPDTPDAPPGLSSGHFHDQVQEGTRLLVRAPAGHFHLMDAEPLPIVLLGSGIGITPMLSILDAVLESRSSRQVWLYYGVRDGTEHIMREHLQELAREHPSFRLHVCYSNPGATDVEGVDYQHRGRIDVSLLRATLLLRRCQFYVCGPKAMLESLVPALEAWGVDSGDIHYESFGPASISRAASAQRVAAGGRAQPMAITFSKSGRRIPWDPAAHSLLEFAEANGIAVESGCRAGSCGSCQTAIQSGEVAYKQPPDADVAPGHCLLCVTLPTGNLTLAT